MPVQQTSHLITRQMGSQTGALTAAQDRRGQFAAQKRATAVQNTVGHHPVRENSGRAK